MVVTYQSHQYDPCPCRSVLSQDPLIVVRRPDAESVTTTEPQRSQARRQLVRLRT